MTTSGSSRDLVERQRRQELAERVDLLRALGNLLLGLRERGAPAMKRKGGCSSPVM